MMRRLRAPIAVAILIGWLVAFALSACSSDPVAQCEERGGNVITVLVADRDDPEDDYDSETWCDMPPFVPELVAAFWYQLSEGDTLIWPCGDLDRLINDGECP